MPRIGILGAGQLAKMMIAAGRPLGLDFIVLDPAEDACAGRDAEFICAAYDDPRALDTIAAAADVITFDFENVPVAAVERLQAGNAVFPDARALSHTQDRLQEKRLLQSLDIPTAAFFEVNQRPDLLAAVEAIGLPAVLKTRRMGYDGKGQYILRQQEDLERAWQQLGQVPLILEQFIPFEHECSVIAVRGQKGELAFWPLALNVHSKGVLAANRAPWGDARLQAQAQDLITRLLAKLDYVGVMALELFLHQGALLANEIAPRVHNTGHWSIEGAETSQFENHLRALCGMPLGGTEANGLALMLNCLGQMPSSRIAGDSAAVHWHDYGKSARPGRKVGHVTFTGENPASLQALALAQAADLGESMPQAVLALFGQAADGGKFS